MDKGSMAASWDYTNKYKVLWKLLTEEENNVCFDCKKKADSDMKWASITYGVFLCDDCSAIHRTLGLNLSFVRGVYGGSWSRKQLQMMVFGGNHRARVLFRKLGWIDANKIDEKYISKKYASEAANLYRQLLAREVAKSMADEAAVSPSDQPRRKGIKILIKLLGDQDDNMFLPLDETDIFDGHVPNDIDINTTKGSYLVNIRKIHNNVMRLYGENWLKIWKAYDLHDGLSAHFEIFKDDDKQKEIPIEIVNKLNLYHIKNIRLESYNRAVDVMVIVDSQGKSYISGREWNLFCELHNISPSQTLEFIHQRGRCFYVLIFQPDGFEDDLMYEYHPKRFNAHQTIRLSFVPVDLTKLLLSDNAFHIVLKREMCDNKKIIVPSWFVNLHQVDQKTFAMLTTPMSPNGRFVANLVSHSIKGNALITMNADWDLFRKENDDLELGTVIRFELENHKQIQQAGGLLFNVSFPPL